MSKITVEDKKIWHESGWLWLTIVLTVLVYSRSIFNEFISDDLSYIGYCSALGLEKSLLQLWSFSNWRAAFPFTMSCLCLEQSLWGLNAQSYHVINLTLHLLNALLLFGLLRRIAPSVAGIVTLIFAIHPIQVETVAWIAEQKNLVCFLFLMLAVHSFLDFDGNGTRKDYVKTLIFFVIAIFSKCIALCFVAIPLLHAWWKRGSISTQDIIRIVPFCILSVFSVILPMRNEEETLGPLFLPFLERVILAGKNFFFYIRQICLPGPFLMFYPKWNVDSSIAWNWLVPFGVILLYGAFFFGRQRWVRGAFALFCFYGVSIFPALGFVKLYHFNFSYASDHFAYLSVPPILLLFCLMGEALFLKLGIFLSRQGAISLAYVKKIIVSAVTVFLCLASYDLTLNYRNTLVLAADFFKKAPQSPVAPYVLGLAYFKVGDFQHAYEAFSLTILRSPKWKDGYEGLGASLMNLGRVPEAVKAFEETCRLAPGSVSARSNLEYARRVLGAK